MTHSSYTRQRIFDAFNELLNHMPFEKITVEMIINQSGVSKSTFYRYFHDKYDVLNFNSMVLAERLIGQRSAAAGGNSCCICAGESPRIPGTIGVPSAHPDRMLILDSYIPILLESSRNATCLPRARLRLACVTAIP